MEIVTEPAPVSGRFIPEGARAIVGVLGVVSPDPMPMILFPGYEYHICEQLGEDGEPHWRLERRVASRPNGAKP